METQINTPKPLVEPAYDNIRNNAPMTKSELTSSSKFNKKFGAIMIAVGLIVLIICFYFGLATLAIAGAGGVILVGFAVFSAGKKQKRMISTAQDNKEDYLVGYNHPRYGSIENIQSIIDHTNDTAIYYSDSYVFGEKYIVCKKNYNIIYEFDKIVGLCVAFTDESDSSRSYYVRLFEDENNSFDVYKGKKKEMLEKAEEVSKLFPYSTVNIDKPLNIKLKNYKSFVSSLYNKAE